MHDTHPRREQYASDRQALAATLRTSADLVESAARSVSPTGLAGWYVPPLGDYLVLGGGENRQASIVAWAHSPELAAYLALWSPLVALTTAYMLRQVAHEIDSYNEFHRLPPPLARSLEKRAVWAGELAGHFLRSLNVSTPNPSIPAPSAGPDRALAEVVNKLHGELAELPEGIHAFAHDVFAILRGLRPKDAKDTVHGNLLDSLPSSRVARMLEGILSAWVSAAPLTVTTMGTRERTQVIEPTVQPLADAARRFLDGGYAR